MIHWLGIFDEDAATCLRVEERNDPGQPGTGLLIDDPDPFVFGGLQLSFNIVCFKTEMMQAAAFFSKNLATPVSGVIGSSSSISLSPTGNSAARTP